MTVIALTGAGKSRPANPPIAEFMAEQTTGTSPHTTSFTDLSTGAPTSWHWEKREDLMGSWEDFAGGGVNEPNPVEEFQMGFWSIRLTVTNADGSDTETKDNYIDSQAA